MRFTYWRQGACVLAAFVALAIAQTWPLALHMGTHLTGQPTGDTGVYVWNLWVFQHELIGTGTTPFRTLEILPLAGPADLSLHNYTVFSDLLALPFLGWLGIIKTFNLTYLANVALAGIGMFLLARRLTGRVVESVIAGAMFAWAPFLVTRGSGHFSLAAAAPLPIFMLTLYRAWDSQRLRDAVLAGVVVAWAAFCDPYYAVYCLMLGGAFVVSRVLDVALVRRPADQLRAARHLVHVALAAIILLIVGINVIGRGVVEIGSFRISMRTLYTPMLVLTVLVLARLAMAINLRVTTLPIPPRRFLLRSAMACGVAAVLFLSPVLYAVGLRMIEGRMPADPVFWRSSAPGVDLLAFFVPNPNHPLAPEALRSWVGTGAGGFHEQVASLSWIGAIVIVAAWGLAAFRPGRFWLWLTAGFGLLAMGPFLQIAGVNTYVPLPWALLRYVPVVGAARMPGRMSILVMLGFCALFAMALAGLTRRYPQRRPLILAAVALLLGLELLPAPRTLYAASVPRVYEVIAADPRPVRVLTLPTGVRDGVEPIGNFDAATQFYQAFHGKGLIGGYLSRVSPRRKQVYRREPVMGALLKVSEGRKLSPNQIDRAIAGADDFLRMTGLGYVVMKRDGVSDDVRDFATILFGLTKIADADGYELYVPRQVN